MENINIEVEVPSSLESIPLWKHQKYMDVVEKNKDVETDEAIEFVNKKLIEIYCDIPFKDVYSISVKSYNDVSFMLSNVFQEDTPLVRTFFLGEVEYGFIPNLDKMSYGEYYDIERSIGDWKNIHIAMAALYRPITKKYKDKYQIEKYTANEDYLNAIKYMPLNVTMGAMVFFYRLGKELSIYTLKSLEMEKEENQNFQPQETLQKNGGGISQFIASLEVTCLDLEKLLKPHFTYA